MTEVRSRKTLHGVIREHRCENRERGEHWFPHRTRGGNKFCNADCREAHSARQWGLRKARERERASRRQFMRDCAIACAGGVVSELAEQGVMTLLEWRPPTVTGRDEQSWNLIEEFDRLLSTCGPHDVAARGSLLNGVRDLFRVIRADPTRSATERVIRARAFGILRDIGVGKSALDESAHLMAAADEAVRLFDELGDKTNLIRALLGAGNTARFLQNDEGATKPFLHAYRLATTSSVADNADEPSLQLRHQAAFWVVRTHRREDVRKEAIREMERVLNQTNNPFVHLEHHRELAGYLTQQGAFPLAAREITLAQRLRDRLTLNGLRSDYDAPTFLRAEIELGLASNASTDKERAIDLIRTQYADAYRGNPHAYYARQLAAWRRSLKISLPDDLPPQSYGSPVLVYLPRFV